MGRQARPLPKLVQPRVEGTTAQLSGVHSPKSDIPALVWETTGALSESHWTWAPGWEALQSRVPAGMGGCNNSFK